MKKLEKLPVGAFKPNQISNIDAIRGGNTCTGGGFHRNGDGSYVQWDSDETDSSGKTTYHGLEAVK